MTYLAYTAGEEEQGKGGRFPVRQRRVDNTSSSSAFSNAGSDDAEEGVWVSAAITRIFELTKLPAGWDGHAGIKVNVSTAIFAMEVMKHCAIKGVPEPAIVPLSYGGVQLEWHRRGWDLELEILQPNSITVLASKSGSTQCAELTLSTDLAPLMKHLRKIAG